MLRPRTLAPIAVAILSAVILQPAAVGQPAAGSGGLESIFAPGDVWQDRNGDDVLDFVAAALVLGDDPDVDTVAAAGDVAARLGLETMAMDLPVARTPEAGAGIVVGRAGIAAAGLSEETVGVADLAPGAGIVARVGDDSGSEWIVVAGVDAAGTRAAAGVFAGRLPWVWTPGGARLDDVTAEVVQVLDAAGVVTTAVEVTRLAVAPGADGLDEIVVSIGLEDGGAADAARTALEAVEATRATPADDDADASPETEEEGDDEPSLAWEGVRQLRVRLQGPDGAATEAVVAGGAAEPRDGPIPGRPGSGPKPGLDLSTVLHIDGLLGDGDGNVIPDRIDAVLSPHGPGIGRTVDLAARLGLESAGLVVPVVKGVEEIDEPGSEPTLVLIGTEHPLLADLREEGKLQLVSDDPAGGLEPGQGLIQVVPDAFGPKRALVVSGDDGAGVDRALEQVAERLPHLWERGADRTTLDDVEQDIWEFVSIHSPGGQAAAALYKLDRIVADLQEQELQSATITVSVEEAQPGLEDLVRARADALGIEALDVVIDDRDVQSAGTIFQEEFDVPSEVDDFRAVLRDRVLPVVEPGTPIRVHGRLSEPMEVRRRLAAEVRRELIAAGAAEDGTDVEILSAFKQGFSWLEERIMPALEGREVDSITISFDESVPPDDWPYQAMTSRVRWLKEIFPIAEVLARGLETDLDAIEFEMTPPDEEPIYRVVATGADGETLLDESFSPKYVLRPYYDRFDDYERVRVTTGWIHAASGDRTLVDERVVTDLERFWDHYQADTLQRVYDYVMERHEGDPRASDAPYFGELEVEVSLSEPDRLLDIDKEYISSLDSLHEEVYFPTILFFRMLGRMTRGQELTYPGRIIPIMRPKADGEAGSARIRFTGFATSRPAVVVDYVRGDGSEGQERLDLPQVEVERPSALAATVRAGQEGLQRLDVRVRVDTERDEYDELLLRASEEQVSTTMMSAEQVEAMVDNLGELRAAGLYGDELAWHGLGELRIITGWEHEIEPESQSVVALTSNGSPPPWPSIDELLPEGYTYQGEELVQWDTPIPPPEGNGILARMSTFPEATVYKMGESYLGKPIWAMDLMPPVEASHWSREKASNFKPTVVYSARQHANEVSSTSHVLKLAELLLTDEEFRAKLDDVNVVIHPFTNPDGAQLAYDLYEITPEFILHAGYLGALGIDATSGAEENMPIYPESKVRPKLWRMWLPDIFLNPHGYPSHEVVQLFSEYAGLVRRGRITERNWSVNKGWFIPGFGYLDDPEYPRHDDAAMEIRDYITDYITAAAEVDAMNRRTYDRYRRYGMDFEPETYRLEIHDGVNIHMPLKGGRAGEGGAFGGGFNPKVTIWTGGTEAPDETAHGDWMKLVATAGLQWDKAILDYLYEGEHRVERNGSSHWGGTSMSLHRPRPPEDPEEENAGAEPDEGSR